MNNRTPLLRWKKIVVVGAGGTGCHLLPLLAEEGAELTIIDRDVVEESNLNRQILYTKEDIGEPKATIAARKLEKKENPRIRAIFDDLNHKNIQELIQRPDIIIDCTDNIETRLLINDYCKKNNLAWIHTAATGNLGTIYLVKEGPCYRCVFQEKYGESCNTEGVLNETLALVAKYTLKAATDFLKLGKTEKDLIRVNLQNKTMHIQTAKNHNCPACNANYEYLEGKKGRLPERLCGNQRYIIETGRTLNLDEIAKRIKNVKKKTKEAIITEDYTIMAKGRVLIKAKTEVEARKKFDQEIGI